jgi:diadenylate cyclase
MGSTIKMLAQIFDWREALDILILSTGLFLGYRTLYRLGTWKMASGVLIAIIVFLVAYLLDLKSVSWIYLNLSQVALIGLIVIFQPEIRKILERAASFGGGPVRNEEADLSVLLAETTFAMAQIKQGALIVLPGKEPIQEWLSGGYPIDAAPSHPLLMSIFDDHSPGHDGAVIIENGKITRFGARLPLSDTGNLDEDYGTRHHAAMGLSENSDAIVIVVSEERGEVTVFQDGKMRKIRGSEELRSSIVKHSANIALVGGHRQEIISWRTLSRIFASVVLAILIWSTIIISQGTVIQKGIAVPIAYTGLPKNMALVEKRPTEAVLHISGTEYDLDVLDPSQMSIQFDLSNVTKGKHNFVITEEKIDLPKRVKLIDAEPSNLTLTVEELEKRKAVVKPRLVGKLPEGLKLISFKVIPHSIFVLLPKSEEKQEKLFLPTKEISLENIKETTTVNSQIAAPPNLQPVSDDWPEVEVEITVGLTNKK